MATTKRADVEAVKAALRNYGAKLLAPCPSCGAGVGQRCRSVGGTAWRTMDAPHTTRRPVVLVEDGARCER